MELIVEVESQVFEPVSIVEFQTYIDYVRTSRRCMKTLRNVYVTRDGVTTFIAAGTKWDGASIPAWAWWFIGKPWEQKFALASLFHDLTLDHEAFRKLLDMAGVNGRRVALMYYAVKAWGWVTS